MYSKHTEFPPGFLQPPDAILGGPGGVNTLYLFSKLPCLTFYYFVCSCTVFFFMSHFLIYIFMHCSSFNLMNILVLKQDFHFSAFFLQSASELFSFLPFINSFQIIIILKLEWLLTQTDAALFYAGSFTYINVYCINNQSFTRHLRYALVAIHLVACGVGAREAVDVGGVG